MPLGEPVGGSGDEVLHARRQVGLRCTEEEVEAAGHEEETEQVPTEPPHRLLQRLEQPLVVRLVHEEGAPEVATGHDVRDRAGVFDPPRSGHGPIRSPGARPENWKPGPIPRRPLTPRSLSRDLSENQKSKPPPQSPLRVVFFVRFRREGQHASAAPFVDQAIRHGGCTRSAFNPHRHD
jgi:hypothetical protein